MWHTSIYVFSQSDDDDDDNDTDDDVKSIDDDYIALVSLDCLRFSLRSSSFAFSSDAWENDRLLLLQTIVLWWFRDPNNHILYSQCYVTLTYNSSRHTSADRCLPPWPPAVTVTGSCADQQGPQCPRYCWCCPWTSCSSWSASWKSRSAAEKRPCRPLRLVADLRANVDGDVHNTELVSDLHLVDPPPSEPLWDRH